MCVCFFFDFKCLNVEFARMLSHHDRPPEIRSVCHVWFEGAQQILYTSEVNYAEGGLLMHECVEKKTAATWSYLLGFPDTTLKWSIHNIYAENVSVEKISLRHKIQEESQSYYLDGED